MRTALLFPVALLAMTLALPAFAGGDDASAPPPVACSSGIPGGVNCIVSKKEMKEAREAFARGLKLQDHQRLDEAFSHFNEATRLVPQELRFLTARELVKAQLVFNHVQRGNVLLAENSRPQAAAEFLRRPRSRSREPVCPGKVTRNGSAGQFHRRAACSPRASRECRGDSSSSPRTTEPHFILVAMRSADYSPPSWLGMPTESALSSLMIRCMARQVRFNVDDVDFFGALKLACQVSKVMWAALDAHQLLIAAG